MAIYGNPGIGCGPLRAKLNRKQRNTMSYDKNVAQQYAELGTKCRTKPKKNNSLRRILGFSLMFLFSLNFFSFFCFLYQTQKTILFLFMLCSMQSVTNVPQPQHDSFKVVAYFLSKKQWPKFLVFLFFRDSRLHRPKQKRKVFCWRTPLKLNTLNEHQEKQSFRLNQRFSSEFCFLVLAVYEIEQQIWIQHQDCWKLF